MQIALTAGAGFYLADLSRPLDISIPLRAGLETVNCFYAPPMEAEPVVAGDFIGSTERGGPVNFLNVRINPHGNGTHTECVGHIAGGPFTINQSLRQFHYLARLVSIYPEKKADGDRLITLERLKEALAGEEAEAVVIRTLPNDDFKLRTHYSGSNPPYLDHRAAQWLAGRGVRHLLIDLPSVDREEDGGKLLAHRAFWQYPEATRGDATISELIFVNNSIRDGLYLLNIQVASFEIDVSPSKPVLYELEPV